LLPNASEFFNRLSQKFGQGARFLRPRAAAVKTGFMCPPDKDVTASAI
jgi:hypothetical protein